MRRNFLAINARAVREGELQVRPQMNRAAIASGSPQTAPDAALAPRRSRLEWLDAFRGAAVLVMIETHVVNTFLASGLREHAWFPLLNYANGLVAPSFLFIAGFVVGLERRLTPDRPIRYARRAKRLGGLAAIGAFMHLPWPDLREGRWADALRVGVPVDVLLCVAVALGLLLAVSWISEKLAPAAGDGRSRIWWVGVVTLAAGMVLGAPMLADWTQGPALLRGFVNFTTGSLFPLFPWAGFVLLGTLAGAWPERPATERMGAIVALFVVGWFSRDTIFSASSPSFFLERAAWVLGLALVAEACRPQAFPRLVRFAGEHSLTLYLSHLSLLSLLVGFGLPERVWSWPVTLAAIAVVGAVSLALTRLLQWRPASREAELSGKRSPASEASAA